MQFNALYFRIERADNYDKVEFPFQNPRSAYELWFPRCRRTDSKIGEATHYMRAGVIVPHRDGGR